MSIAYHPPLPTPLPTRGLDLERCRVQSVKHKTDSMAKLEPQHPLLIALHDRVRARPRIAAYLSSSRRLAFNQQGIFRRYAELEEEQKQEE